MLPGAPSDYEQVLSPAAHPPRENPVFRLIASVQSDSGLEGPDCKPDGDWESLGTSVSRSSVTIGSYRIFVLDLFSCIS